MNSQILDTNSQKSGTLTDGSIHLKFIFPSGREDIYTYSLDTKYGRIREDLFLSPFNTVTDRRNFGMDIKGLSINTHTDEQINSQYLFSRHLLENKTLSELGIEPLNRITISIYDISSLTSRYTSNIYRNIGSITILSLYTAMFGLTKVITLWIIGLCLKIYRIYNDPDDSNKKIRCKYGTIINNGIYDWLFVAIMGYDIYFGDLSYGYYSTFSYIGAILSLFHIWGTFSEYQDKFKDNKTRNTYRYKLIGLELAFLISMCSISISIFQIIYSIIIIWRLLANRVSESRVSESKVSESKVSESKVSRPRWLTKILG